MNDSVRVFTTTGARLHVHRHRDGVSVLADTIAGMSDARAVQDAVVLHAADIAAEPGRPALLLHAESVESMDRYGDVSEIVSIHAGAPVACRHCRP